MWVSYDGMHDDYEKLNIENCTKKQLIEKQGKVFCTIGAVYCKMKVIHLDVESGTKDDDINIEKDFCINSGEKMV